VKVLLQRVSSASVSVNQVIRGHIGTGLLVFAAVEPDDHRESIATMAERLLAYRIFNDDLGKMNKNVGDVGGGVLVVSQFTLAADTRKGLRPSFSSAASPTLAKELFAYFVECLNQRHSPVETGEFGADMQVALVNDGPVTFLL